MTFIDQYGQQVEETYMIQPDRSLKIVHREIVPYGSMVAIDFRFQVKGLAVFDAKASTDFFEDITGSS
jgi:hypothetical protein